MKRERERETEIITSVRQPAMIDILKWLRNVVEEMANFVCTCG